jgi:hypothetical protein
MAAAAVNSVGAQGASNEANCKANQSGQILLTSVEYDSGYKVEAPWRVTSTRKIDKGITSITAVLDLIIETDASGKRSLTPLPGSIELTFSGGSESAVLKEAANVWCTTVAKALAARNTNMSGRAVASGVVM